MRMLLTLIAGPYRSGTDDDPQKLDANVRAMNEAALDVFRRGHVPITDLADYGLDMPIDSEAYNSVGGYVFGALGRLPKRGDMVRVNGYSLRVESVRENRIEAVRIRDHEPERRSGDELPQTEAAAEETGAG